MALIKCPSCGSVFEKNDFPTNCPMCNREVDDTFKQEYAEEVRTLKERPKSLWQAGKGCGRFFLILLLSVIVVFFTIWLICSISGI